MKNLYTQYYAFFLAGICLIFAGCSHIYYAPNQPHVPNLKTKGDYDIRLADGSGTNVSSLELQAAYSPLKYWSVNLSGAKYYSNKRNQNRGDGKLIDIGTGFYIPVLRAVQLGCNVGYAYGKMEHFYRNSPHGSYLDFDRLSFTPYLNLGLKYVQFFGAVRYSRLQFKNALVTIESSAEALNDIDYIARNGVFNLIEPTYGIRGGTGHVFWEFQFTKVRSPEFRNNDRDLFSHMASFSMSINQELIRHFINKKNKKKLLKTY